ILKEELELLTDIEAWDSGKTRHLNAIYDVEEVIAVFRYYAGWADKVHGRVISQDPKKLAYTVHEPKAGFPPGVVNIISGLGATAGKALAGHLDINKVAFTGSTATGRLVQKLATSNLKAVTLECGGKSPLLVRADADLEQAVKWAAIGIMSNQGQICTS
ncbi:hypothetical protein OXX79_013231, partial [Metschnikowia pulcherrima]